MLESVLSSRLKRLASNSLLRKLKTTVRSQSTAGNHICIEGKEQLVSFSENDYMNLANNELVKKAAIDAIKLYGVGASASRLITGNHPLYQEIEEKLAKIYNTESALVFSSGYLANIGSISAIVGRHDMILADKLIHASAIDGARLSGAKMYRFEHNNLTHLQELMDTYRKHHKNCLIIVENVYGMDGDVAPIDDIMKIARQHDAWLAVDVAHGFGMISSSKPDIYIGTLSKAAGALGGYVCASKTVVAYMQNAARSFIYTTALPPAIVAAASAAIDIIGKNVNAPIQLAKKFCEQLGFPEPQSHIVPIIMASIDDTVRAENILLQHGFFIAAIRPPTVPTPRLRFTFTTAHKLSDIHRLCEIIKQENIV